MPPAEGHDHRVEEILVEALHLAGADRGAYLDSACAGDAALRTEVESLLAADEQAGSFMRSQPPNARFTVPLAEKAGDRIGHYLLLEQIGEGGFGVVWMAEQEDPVRRRVALKIIKWGMDTREVVARFEAERQALAMMDHPNIATVHDGGATRTGRPYFVMELVKGVPITEYCDANRMSAAERLELFIQVCQAVQHAHQKGVIHRDLKPSNILVTVRDDRPVPKVIDFGVAKATQTRLTEKTLFTRFHQWIGTPAYMSPEQAGLGSLDVDTRSDIYSLGVLLYELLTGHTPFDTEKLMAAGYEAMRRMIREQEPVKPSTRLQTLGERLAEIAKRRHAEPTSLTRLLRGDLDRIVLKCLEKDRSRRYETANNLGLDLQRFLKHEPVSAAAPSTPYLARKFIRRHKTGLAMILTVLVLLSAGVVISTWQAFRAEHALRLVEKREAEARENLWASYLATASASRMSGAPGHRFAALDAVAKAAAIRPAPELRSEAASALALVDLRKVQEWNGRLPEWTQIALDRRFERYARNNAGHSPITVRRVNNDRELLSLEGNYAPTRFSPDGRFLLGETPEPPGLAVWNLDTGRLVVESKTSWYVGPDFHPYAPVLAACDAALTVQFFDLAAGTHWSWSAANIPPGVVRFRPDGKQLAISSYEPPQLRVYEADSGILIASLVHSNAVRPVAWSPNGRWLAAPCADGRVYLWDMSQGDGRLDRMLQGHDDVVSAVCFDPQGEFLVSQAWDYATAIWSLHTHRLILKFPDAGYPLSFSADGRMLAPFVSGPSIRLMELERAREHRILPANDLGQCNGVFSPDGRWVVVGGDGLRCSAVASGQPLWTEPIGYVRYVVFRPDGAVLLTLGPAGAREWPWLVDEATGQPRLGSPRALTSSLGVQAEYSRDGSVLVISQRDGLWVSDSHAVAPKLLPMRMCNFASVSPDGRWAAACPWAGADSDLRVWELATGKVVYKRDHTQGSVGFTRDGRWFVVMTLGSGECLEVGTWRTVADASPTPGGFLGHALSASGQWVVTEQGQRGQLVFSDVPSLRPFLKLDSDRQYPICFSRDNALLLSRRQGGAFGIWDLRRIQEELKPLDLAW